MKKIRLFGIFLVLAAILLSCSQPSFPEGNWRFMGQTQPGSTVIKQLKWLQENAQSGGTYIVIARRSEPRIPGNNNFGISFDERESISVTIKSEEGLPPQTLRLLDSGVMLYVGPANTLVLQNVNLQVSDSPAQINPVVEVNGGTLRMINASISGNGGAQGVSANEGTLIMGSGAVIYGNRGGIIARNRSRVYMYGDATIRNNKGTGVFVTRSVLTMNGDALIYNNQTAIPRQAGGISAFDYSDVFMFDNAAVRRNSVGGVRIEQRGTLNMHGNNVQISGNTVNDGSGGGVVFIGGNILFHISGGTVYGNDAPPHLANTASAGSAISNNNAVIRVGSFSKSGGFIPCGLTNISIEHFNYTFRVIDGALR